MRQIVSLYVNQTQYEFTHEINNHLTQSIKRYQVLLVRIVSCGYLH